MVAKAVGEDVLRELVMVIVVVAWMSGACGERAVAADGGDGGKRVLHW